MFGGRCPFQFCAPTKLQRYHERNHQYHEDSYNLHGTHYMSSLNDLIYSFWILMVTFWHRSNHPNFIFEENEVQNLQAPFFFFFKHLFIKSNRWVIGEDLLSTMESFTWLVQFLSFTTNAFPFFFLWHFKHSDSVFMLCLLWTTVGFLLHLPGVLVKPAYLSLGHRWLLLGPGKGHQCRPTVHVSKYFIRRPR